MNAKEYVEHIGLTENWDNESAFDKVMINRDLLEHYEKPIQSKGNLVWLLVKAFFAIFKKSSIPDRMLKRNFSGEYQYSPESIREFEDICRRALLDEVDTKTSGFNGGILNFEPVYHINDTTFNFDEFRSTVVLDKKMTIVKVDVSPKAPQNTTKARVVFSAYRTHDTAKRNKPLLTVRLFVTRKANSPHWYVEG